MHRVLPSWEHIFRMADTFFTMPSVLRTARLKVCGSARFLDLWYQIEGTGLGHVRQAAGVSHGGFKIQTALAAEKDDLRLWMPPLQKSSHRESVESGHGDVENDYRRTEVFEIFHDRKCVFSTDDAQSCAQEFGSHRSDIGVIIDEQDVGFREFCHDGRSIRIGQKLLRENHQRSAESLGADHEPVPLAESWPGRISAGTVFGFREVAPCMQ